VIAPAPEFPQLPPGHPCSGRQAWRCEDCGGIFFPPDENPKGCPYWHGEDLRDDGLTAKEGEVMDRLCDAVAAWRELPEQHPNEQGEFVAAVHTIQGRLATRIARRIAPAGWPTYGPRSA
jgi:uncharacterized OB-fold protein